ncbi:MAG: NB-ARC domain-containing protein [Elainella sp.]
MLRSLRVDPKFIAKAKAAVQRSGFLNQQRLAEDLGLTRSTVSNFLNGKPIDVKNFEEICRKLALDAKEIAAPLEISAAPEPEAARSEPIVPQRDSQQDWGEAPDVSVFYDRESETEMLTSWVGQGCRLIAVLGMGGMGKTALSVKLARQVEPEFDFVIWRSLRNEPGILDLLADLIRFLSHQQEVDLPDSVDGCIRRLIHYLQQQRCLMILDNVESVLQPGDRSGQYQAGYEGYGHLLRVVADTKHQSCLLLTSREKPRGLAQREGWDAPVRSLQLDGLDGAAGQAVIRHQGWLNGSESEWQRLVQHYAGNPLALKMVAVEIKDSFGSEIGGFLAYASRGSLVFGDISDLLNRQVERLSELELEVMRWLAINREPVTVEELREDLGLSLESDELLTALGSLRHRSLIEAAAGGWTQQPVVMEFMGKELLLALVAELTAAELTGGSANLAKSLLRRYALAKATAKDYLRESQIRLFVEPLIARAVEQLGTVQALEAVLRQGLEQFRRSQISARYAVGNILHLLHQIGADLTGLDLAGLQIWQANLANLRLHGANLARAQVARSTFAETFGSVLSVAFSPDGKWLAAGESNGTIQIWEVATGCKQMTLRQHRSWVWAVVFAPHPGDPEQQILVSASDDYQIKLWDLQTGDCLRTLTGHQRSVNTLALSPDGQWIASGSLDTTIRLWNLRQPDQPPRVLAGHGQRVWSVTFSPSGRTLASASEDHTVKLWDVASGECQQTFAKDAASNAIVGFSPDGRLLANGDSEQTICLRQIDAAVGPGAEVASEPVCLRRLYGHRDNVSALSFSLDGRYLASSSYDQTAKLWDLRTGQCLRTLQGHRNRLWSVAFSPDGTLLATGGDDRAVRLWDGRTGQCTKALQGHTNAVLSLALVEEHEGRDRLLVSGHEDEAIRIWNTRTGELLRTLRGHQDRVWSVGFAPVALVRFLGLHESEADPERIVISGSADRTIKLWDWRSGDCLKTLRGHKSWVWSVVCSPCGRYLASGSYDRTIKLWDLQKGDCFDSWTGERSDVTLTFSPNGELLASSGFDGCIKLWNTETRQLVRRSEGHRDSVWQACFSADGQQLASASYDQTLRLWDVNSGECLRVFTGHRAPVLAVAFADKGRLISSSFDQTVRVWDLETGECLQVMHGHSSHIPAVISAGQETVFSGSFDETIRLWDLNSGECLQMLRVLRPYEQMNIAGLVGLTAAEMENLRNLGAIEL